MQHQYEHPHPAVTTDIVIFTIEASALKVLLVKRGHAPFDGQWALPGGFVQMSESLEQCALRELEEETGIKGVYLEQLYTFGAPSRDPRERVITVSYFALVPAAKLTLRASSDAQAVAWFDLHDLPPLAFDHGDIVELAQQRLAAKLEYSTIAFQFMPKEFTLSELQGVYETILDAKIDKRNFRKKVLALKSIEETGNQRRDGAYRPAKLYRLTDPDQVQIIK